MTDMSAGIGKGFSSSSSTPILGGQEKRTADRVTDILNSMESRDVEGTNPRKRDDFSIMMGLSQLLREGETGRNAFEGFCERHQMFSHGYMVASSIVADNSSKSTTIVQESGFSDFLDKLHNGRERETSAKGDDLTEQRTKHESLLAKIASIPTETSQANALESS